MQGGSNQCRPQRENRTKPNESFRDETRQNGVKLLILVITSLGLATWTMAQPAEVILIRHAEKPANPEALHLSKEGVKRANALVPYITTAPELTRHGLPVALYAARTTKHGHGQRTHETIAPLSKELHLPIQAPYLSEDYAALAKSILSNRKYRGKTVLICWVHESIPQLAAALGVRPEPPKWKGEVYDRVYLISYEGGKATLQDLPQKLSSKPGPHQLEYADTTPMRRP